MSRQSPPSPKREPDEDAANQGPRAREASRVGTADLSATGGFPRLTLPDGSLASIHPDRIINISAEGDANTEANAKIVYTYPTGTGDTTATMYVQEDVETLLGMLNG